MKSNTQKVVEAETPKSLTEVGVDAVDAAIKAAAPYIDQAREIGAARVADAQTRIAPFTATAQARLAPLAEQAQEIITECAQEAQARLAPVAQEAQARFAPVAREAKARGVAGARGTLDTLAPRLEQALLAVGPLAEEAATRIKEDVVPRAEKLLDKAAEAVAGETGASQTAAVDPAPAKGRKARKESKSAAKLAKAQAKLALAEEKLAAREGRKGGGTWKVLLVLAGLIGIGIIVAKKLGSPKEDAWQNYQPTSPAPARPDAPAPAEEAAPAEEVEVSDEMDDETAEAEAEMIGEGGGISEADRAVSTDTATSYGPDSFVGTEPPAEYIIKGNPRSMKYHLPGSDSYERTVTDVWFATEEAASAAGFTRATR